jgi:concanavalin A-like lectin/glucanase superfamily protein
MLPNWLDDFFRKVIAIAGEKYPSRPVINFVSGAKAVDNPTTNSTDVTIVGGGPGGVTPLDANHMHAWELTETSGDFADTGSHATKIHLSPAGSDPILYATPGLFGPCPRFGFNINGDNGISGASALVTTGFPNGSVTLECWFRCWTRTPTFLAASDRAGAWNFALFSAATNTIYGTARLDSFLNMATNQNYEHVVQKLWHHVAFVYDAASGFVLIYVDGEIGARVGGQSGAVDWFGGDTPRFSIGYAPNNSTNRFQGQMSRVRISDIARSQAYCREVYRKGMGYPQ